MTMERSKGGRRVIALIAAAVACAPHLAACSDDACDACDVPDAQSVDETRGGRGGIGGSSGGGGAPASSGAGGTMAGAGGPRPGSDAPIPDGACVPDPGPSAGELGAERSVLYAGPRALHQVAARRDSLIVADAEDGLLRAALPGASFTRIVQTRVSEFLAGDLNVYWYEGGAIRRASQNDDDATADLVADGLPSALALRAFDELNLYALDQAAGTIATVPIAGGELSTLARGVDADALELHAGYLYYADRASGHVHRLPVDGGDAEQLTATRGRALAGVHTDGQSLYWSDDIVLFAAPLDDAERAKAIAVGAPAGTSGRSPILRLERVQERLYWSDAHGAIGWTVLDGSDCGLVVMGVADLRGWDVDAQAVYLTVSAADDTSELWRIAL